MAALVQRNALKPGGGPGPVGALGQLAGSKGQVEGTKPNSLSPPLLARLRESRRQELAEHCWYRAFVPTSAVTHTGRSAAGTTAIKVSASAGVA